MRGMLRSCLVALAGMAALAVALIGFRLSQGGLDYSAYAHIADINGNGTITASHLSDPQDTHLEIDMVKDGTKWCDPVDITTNVSVGSTYTVAICLTTAPASPGGFQLELGYNAALNDCVDSAGTPLDSNPDANAGVTKFDGSVAAPNGLGTGWNCNLGDVAPPTCSDLSGKAFLQCNTVSGTTDLPFAWDVSEPIAVVTFSALAAGLDNLTLENVEVDDADTNAYINCFPSDTNYCAGAADNKVPPPPATPTFTPEPTATFTPVPPTPTPPAGVRMEKSPALANLWLMKAGCVVPAEGKGCLVIDLNVFAVADLDNPNDSDEVPEGLGAWEDQKRFDHKFISLTPVPDNTWLQSGGRIANCTMVIVSENNILEGCVTKDDPNVDGQQPGPQGGGLLERIYVIPQLNDLIYRSDFRPTKDNGIITDIVDDNCEVTDTQGEQIQGTLPGQLTTVCSDVHITIRMLEGDMDLDCDVDVLDDQALAFRYGAQLGLQLYDRWFDLEPKWSDDDIDIKDLQFVFGRNYSTCQTPIPDDQNGFAPPVPTPTVGPTPVPPTPTEVPRTPSGCADRGCPTTPAKAISRPRSWPPTARALPSRSPWHRTRPSTASTSTRRSAARRPETPT